MRKILSWIQRVGRRHTATRILLYCALLFALPIRAGSGATVDYLYIEAGEGDSSGGHAAIGFGADVFHYQYVKGLLKAVRQDRKEFEYQYRFLGNRSIHLGRITVSDAAYQRLRDHFIRKYLVQTRQFQGLELLEKDIALLEKLARAATQPDRLGDFRHPIRGAALFSRPQRRVQGTSTFPPPDSSGFSGSVDQEYGPRFIAIREAEIRNSLAALKETRWDPESLENAPDRYPRLPYTFAERFADLLTKQRALAVIRSGASLNPYSRIDSDLPEFDLDLRQVEIIRHFRNELQSDLLKLLGSSRPDWGYALLVGLARLEVLDESIRAGKLRFLSTFRADAERVDPEDLDRYPETFEALVSEARNRFEREKERFFSAPDRDESHYAQIEMFANRYAELARGIAGEPMRIHDGDLAPRAIAELRVPVIPELDAETLSKEPERLKKYASEYFDRLERRYGYHLLTRNCVSEIFSNLEQAMSTDSDGAEQPGSEKIGAVLQPSGSVDHTLWNAIPFVSWMTLEDNFKVRGSEHLLSYRQARLKELYAKDPPLATYFRESNLVTSTLYPWNPDDGLFLFFTDDALLPRPIFGAFNVIAGIGQTLVGGVLAPFRGGDVLFHGIRGLLSSLPELAFFNIRKGSYRYQPFDRYLKREAPADRTP